MRGYVLIVLSCVLTNIIICDTEIKDTDEPTNTVKVEIQSNEVTTKSIVTSKPKPHSRAIQRCPAEAALKPCTCLHRQNLVVCDGDQEFELSAIVTALTSANGSNHYKLLHFMPNKLTEMSANTFKDLTFNGIWLMGAQNLKTIHENAFAGTDTVTTHLVLSYCPSLDSTNIFTIINKFVNIRLISLTEMNIESIPGQAFGPLKHLTMLSITDTKLKTIGEKPFLALNSLKLLTFKDTSIARIPRDVLVFSINYDIPLHITLMENHLLSSASFDADSLTSLGRPTGISLVPYSKNPYQWKYLSETIFKPFLSVQKVEIAWESLAIIGLTAILSVWPSAGHECPYGDVLKPCTCSGDEVFRCGDKPVANMKEIFAKYAKTLKDDDKELEAIVIEGPGVTDIPEAVFGDIYFKRISIQNCPNLKTIHKNAFAGTDTFTQEVTLYNLPKLAATPAVSFDLVNKFQKVAVVCIGHMGLKEIPSMAFGGQSGSIVYLAINGTEITKIADKAFYNLNALTEVHITDTSIAQIPKNVFVFSKKSEIPIEILLYRNPKLTATGMDPLAFMSIGRPAEIDFSGDHMDHDMDFKQMKVLEENVFHPFLKLDEGNKIGMKGQPFDCADCHNAWLKKSPKMAERVD
ncbi:unnamed protein product, partial [Medioppia subpectinata]